MPSPKTTHREGPEEPRKGVSPLLILVLILGIFLILVLIVSILLLPDRGKRLLKLSNAHPVTQTIPHHRPAHC